MRRYRRKREPLKSLDTDLSDRIFRSRTEIGDTSGTCFLMNPSSNLSHHTYTQAAEMAGFQDVELLSEPVAAAMAY